MITFKLEKEITLYKNQFDKFNQMIFGGYLLDRLSLDLDGLSFKIKYMVNHNKDLSNIEELKNQFTEKALELRNTFGTFMYEFLCKIIEIPENCHLEDIQDLMAKDVKIDTIYVKFNMILISNNKNYLEYVDNKIDSNKVFNMFPNEFFRYQTDSYNDAIAKAYPELFENRHQDIVGTGADGDVFCHNFTFQTSERCSLNCFPAGTKILMADLSYKNIEDIKIGDKVIGFQEHLRLNEKLKLSPTNVISPVFKSKKKCIVIEYNYNIATVNDKRKSKHVYENIDFRNRKGKLTVTEDHPILTSDNRWVKAKYLQPTDQILMTFEIDKMLYTIPVEQSVIHKSDKEIDVYNFETFKHTYVANKILVHNCTYCYQFNKSGMRMSFETAKKFIDNLLADKYGYINRYNSPAIIIEFIGGEPLLEINLTRKIYEYFLDRCYELNHPWFHLHRISICSNGLQYFDKEVQDFFKEYAQNISFNISIDGNKELHDSCRIQPNGEGSYDVDMVALNHYNKHYTSERNSKMTLAPSNIKYLFDSVIDFINHGMKVINLNCIFEEGWNQETAKEEYYQLKKLADYIIDNNLDQIYIAIFTERQEDRQDKENDGNFCFKKGTSVLTENGNTDIETIRVGDILYTASGNKHKVVKMSSYHSFDNKILKVKGSYPIHCTSDHKVFAKKFLYTGWKGVNHYSEPGFYPVSELKKGDKVALPILDLSKNKKNWIDLPTAYAIGVFLADGNVNFANNSVVITPGYDEDKYYYKILKDAKLDFTEFKNRTTMIYTIRRSKNKFNERFFKVCASCGHLAHNKHFPHIIFESPDYIIKECIRGFCDTDGYTNRSGLIKANSVSRWLMNDLMILLRSLGELPTSYYYPRAGKMKIEGRIVNVKDRYEVYYLPNNNIEMSKYFQSDSNYPVIWSRVNGVFDDPEDYDVYCPTLMPIDNNKSEEHTIIVDGIAATQCGGIGSMLSLRPNGQFYPCIRYMPTSIGNNVKDLCIGDIDNGLIGREQNSEVLNLMDNITRRSQSNDICFDCPIGNNCAWCSALGHTVYGTPDKRPMFTCIQKIAEALANVYYWNRLLIKHPEYNLNVRKNNVPDEWSLLVIDNDELHELKLLELYGITKNIEKAKETEM